jgi:hypothetical protein
MLTNEIAPALPIRNLCTHNDATSAGPINGPAVPAGRGNLAADLTDVPIALNGADPTSNGHVQPGRT